VTVISLAHDFGARAVIFAQSLEGRLASRPRGRWRIEAASKNAWRAVPKDESKVDVAHPIVQSVRPRVSETTSAAMSYSFSCKMLMSSIITVEILPLLEAVKTKICAQCLEVPGEAHAVCPSI